MKPMRPLALVLSAALVLPCSAQERLSMSYLYFGSPADYIQRVEQTSGSLHEISPNYFNLNPDGSLAVTGSNISQFVQEMHHQGVQVIPFLSNHWNRSLGILALEQRETLARDIAEAVNHYNFDGIHVDIENVTHTEREAYCDFVC